MWLLKFIAGGALSLAGKVGLSGALKFATSLAFPGWGAFGSMLLSAGQAALGFVFDQARKTLADCLKNPRVFIAIGFALLVGHWYGFDRGYGQGEGDLKTYREEAIVYQQQADETAEAATAAKDAAKKAEAAKILSERAKADSDAKAKKATDELAATKAKAEADVKAAVAAKAVAEKAAADAKRRARSKKTTPSSFPVLDWSLATSVFRS